MNVLRMGLLLLVCVSGFADSRANISVTVDGVTYQCTGSGGGGDCKTAADGFRAQLERCHKSYTGGYCAHTYWPKYKEMNPGCVYSGMDACLFYCEKTYTGGYCAGFCS